MIDHFLFIKDRLITCVVIIVVTNAYKSVL